MDKAIFFFEYNSLKIITSYIDQVNNAITAANNGETTLALKIKDDVILASGKSLNSILIDETSFSKILNLSKFMGCTHSGLVPDFKVIVKQTRKEFQTYKLKIHGWTPSGGVRPFGCCVLIAGYDRDGHHLFQIDPFGAHYELKAGALEKNRQKATQTKSDSKFRKKI